MGIFGALGFGVWAYQDMINRSNALSDRTSSLESIYDDLVQRDNQLNIVAGTLTTSAKDEKSFFTFFPFRHYFTLAEKRR